MYPMSPTASATKSASCPVRLNWVAIAGIAKPMSVMSKKVKKYPVPMMRTSEAGNAQTGILSIRAIIIRPRSESGSMSFSAPAVLLSAPSRDPSMPSRVRGPLRPY